MEQNLKSIQTVVADELATAGPKVAQILKDQLVNAKIAKRVEAVTSAIAQLDKLRKENRGIKPDAVTVQVVNGVEQKVENWTEPGLKKKKEADAKIEKLSKAIDTALNDNSDEAYGKLADASK